jgi:hypothetical protein
LLALRYDSTKTDPVAEEKVNVHEIEVLVHHRDCMGAAIPARCIECLRSSTETFIFTVSSR